MFCKTRVHRCPICLSSWGLAVLPYAIAKCLFLRLKTFVEAKGVEYQVILSMDLV